MRKFKVLKHKTKEHTYGDFVVLKDEEIFAETNVPMLFPTTSNIPDMKKCVDKRFHPILDEFEMIEVQTNLPEAPLVTYKQDEEEN